MTLASTWLRRAAGALLTALLLGFGPAGAAPSPESVTRFIDTLGDRYLEIVSDEQLSRPDREVMIEGVLRGNLAFEDIGRYTLGTYWKKATPAQRDDFQKAFADYLLVTYARLLGGYDGRSFEITGTGPVDGAPDDLFVMTTITDADGDRTGAAWRVRELDGRVLLVDVVIDGVSIGVTKKSEVASVIRTKGIDGVIDTLRHHAAAR